MTGSLTGALLLGLLLWQWSPQPLQEVFKADAPEVNAFPLFYMHDVKTTQYAVDGSPAYLLETEAFNYYEGQGTTSEQRQANSYATLAKPLITFYDQDLSVWRFSAAKGQSRNDGALIQLQGDVRLWQLQNGVTTTELTTQSLTIKPNQAFAQTSDPVVFKSISGVTMQSTGLKLFIESSKAEFLSAVKGRYDRL